MLHPPGRHHQAQNHQTALILEKDHHVIVLFDLLVSKIILLLPLLRLLHLPTSPHPRRHLQPMASPPKSLISLSLAFPSHSASCMEVRTFFVVVHIPLVHHQKIKVAHQRPYKPPRKPPCLPPPPPPPATAERSKSLVLSKSNSSIATMVD